MPELFRRLSLARHIDFPTECGMDHTDNAQRRKMPTPAFFRVLSGNSRNGRTRTFPLSHLAKTKCLDSPPERKGRPISDEDQSDAKLPQIPDRALHNINAIGIMAGRP